VVWPITFGPMRPISPVGQKNTLPLLWNGCAVEPFALTQIATPPSV
jgi:hypothetical protein